MRFAVGEYLHYFLVHSLFHRNSKVQRALKTKVVCNPFAGKPDLRSFLWWFVGPLSVTIGMILWWESSLMCGRCIILLV